MRLTDRVRPVAPNVAFRLRLIGFVVIGLALVTRLPSRDDAA